MKFRILLHNKLDGAQQNKLDRTQKKLGQKLN